MASDGKDGHVIIAEKFALRDDVSDDRVQAHGVVVVYKFGDEATGLVEVQRRIPADAAFDPTDTRNSHVVLLDLSVAGMALSAYIAHGRMFNQMFAQNAHFLFQGEVRCRVSSISGSIVSPLFIRSQPFSHFCLKQNRSGLWRRESGSRRPGADSRFVCNIIAFYPPRYCAGPSSNLICGS